MMLPVRLGDVVSERYLRSAVLKLRGIASYIEGYISRVLPSGLSAEEILEVISVACQRAPVALTARLSLPSPRPPK